LAEKTVNAFSHCLKAAKFNLDEACNAYARMLHRSYSLSGGRFIIDSNNSSTIEYTDIATEIKKK